MILQIDDGVASIIIRTLGGYLWALSIYFGNFQLYKSSYLIDKDRKPLSWLSAARVQTRDLVSLDWTWVWKWTMWPREHWNFWHPLTHRYQVGFFLGKSLCDYTLSSIKDPLYHHTGILGIIWWWLVAKSCLTLATPWTVVHKAPLAMWFPRQEYWSGGPFPSPEDHLDTGIKRNFLHNRWSPALYADSFFFSFIFISWRLITLQYCSGFCHTLIWISHGYTCIPHPDPLSRLPLHPIPLGLPSAPAPSTCLMHPARAGDLFHPW